MSVYIGFDRCSVCGLVCVVGDLRFIITAAGSEGGGEEEKEEEVFHIKGSVGLGLYSICGKSFTHKMSS